MGREQLGRPWDGNSRELAERQVVVWETETRGREICHRFVLPQRTVPV